MKIFMVSALVLFLGHQVMASGCTFYGDIRTVVKDDMAAIWPGKDLQILSRTDRKVTILEKSSGTTYELGWEKSEKYEDSNSNTLTEKRDVLFEEGNGCGPIYRCVTGQLRISFADAKTGRVDVYSYPTVNEARSSETLKYINGALLPVFGNMKLDVPLVEDKTQCGYGNW